MSWRVGKLPEQNERLTKGWHTIMGACDFYNVVSGKTVQEAFNDAVSQARYDKGARGYTGTIAEKHNFTMIATVQTYDEANELRRRLMEADDERIKDKWGPAGCIEFKEQPKAASAGAKGTRWFMFFGWASS